MVRVLTRRVGSVFGATVNATVPAPLPDVPEVIATQAVSDPPFQEHPAAVVTATEPAPPAAPNDVAAAATA